MDEILAKIKELVAEHGFRYGLQIAGAVAIFFAGVWAAKLLRAALRKLLTKRKVDEAFVSFATSFVFILSLVLVIVAAMSALGVQTTSLVAIVGAAGLAIGLALQGALGNFAAGVLLIVFHPFKAGDYIEGGGIQGTVEEVEIFTTKLRTLDNRLAVVPNAKLTNDNIINHTEKDCRRLEFTVGVSYDTDLDKARQVISDALAGDERILKDPPPTIAVVELAEGPRMSARVDAPNEDLKVGMALKTEFEEAGEVSVPVFKPA